MAFLRLGLLLLFFLQAKAEDNDTCEGSAGDSASWISHERRLLKCLLADYDPDVRPVANHSDVVNVTIEMRLADIVKFDVVEQYLDVNAYLVKQWKDFQLKWDQEKYGDVKEVHIAKDKIWLPDISLLNNAALDGEYVTDRLVTVLPDGTVTWSPHARLRAQCTPYMHRFPFDTQRCRIVFGSYTYDKSMLDINLVSNETLYYHYEDREWDVIKYTAEKTVWKKLKTVTKVLRGKHFKVNELVDLPLVQYTLTMKRSSVFYGSLLVSPVVMLVILTNFMFLVPAESSERLTLGIGILIALSVMASVIDDYLPRDLNEMPIIFIYLLYDFVMTTFGILVSMFVIRCTYRENSKSKVPRLVRDIFLGKLRRLVCIKAESYSAVPSETYARSELPVERELTAPDEELPRSPTLALEKVLGDIRLYLKQLNSQQFNSQQQRQEVTPSHRQLVVSEWLQVAAVLDRIFFIIYIILSVVITVAVLSH